MPSWDAKHYNWAKAWTESTSLISNLDDNQGVQACPSFRRSSEPSAHAPTSLPGPNYKMLAKAEKCWFISSWNFKSGSISGAGSFIGTCGCRYSHLLLPCLLCWFSSQSYSLNSQKESITISFQYNSPYLNFVLIQKRTQTELDWSATRRGQIPGRESNLTLSQRPHAPRRDGPVLFLDIHRVILVCIAFSSSDAR